MRPNTLAGATTNAERIGALLGVDAAAAEAVATLGRTRALAPGTIAHTPGARAEGLSVLLKGSVRLYRLDATGAETVLGELAPGDVFGEAHAGVHASFAEAATPSLVCALDAPALERLTEAHPRAALRLMAALAERIAGLADQLERAARWGVRERLIALLVRHAGPDGQVRGLTHEQMASAVWATRQTVTQELSALTAEGLVSVGRRRVLLRDPITLRALVTDGAPPRRARRR
jgi:CRP/FNR family cyclic AMP-dependent transcriptional regulator